MHSYSVWVCRDNVVVKYTIQYSCEVSIIMPTDNLIADINSETTVVLCTNLISGSDLLPMSL